MSRYSNRIMKNNVHATLSTATSSIATTIQLTSGQGARFGNDFPQIATIESFDGNGKVVKREIVQITGRTGDALTVVRAYAPCPENDDANSQTQTAISFNADDTISLYIPKEIFDIIADSLNDIYDNGTNNLRTEFVSGLDVEVNAGPVLVGSSYYDFAGGTITLTDNATNYLEIDEDGNLASNTTDWNEENTKLAIITTSGGSVTNIKDRRLGTVGGKIGGLNIHELTEKIDLVDDDEFVVSDSENIRQNKKVKMGNIAPSSLSYNSEIEAGENLSKGDAILNTFPCYSGDLVSNSIDFGGTNSQIAIKQIANGKSMSSVDVYLKATEGSTATGLTLKIESDNNGTPSGTALASTNIISQLQVLKLPVSGNATEQFNSALNASYYKLFGFSENGRFAFLSYYNTGNNYIYLYSLPSAYNLNSGTSSSSFNFAPASGRGFSNYTRGSSEMDDGTFCALGCYGSRGQAAPIYFKRFNSSGTVLNSSTNLNIDGIIAGVMGKNGKDLYLLHYLNGSPYTISIDRYSCTTQYDISNLTFIESVNVGTGSSNIYFLYAMISISKGYIHVFKNPNLGTSQQICSVVLNDDGSLGTIASAFSSVLTPSTQPFYCFVSYDGKHFSGNGYTSNKYQFTCLNTLGLDTTLKKRTANFTSQSIASGTPYRITLTPTGGSGDRFSLGYIEKNTTNYNLSEYDGANWTDDNTKYPYAFGEGNNAQFYLKASADNQGSDTKQSMIVRKNANAFDKVSFDFFGISKRLENLVAGSSYYLSSTPGQISTTGTGFKVGEALSETDLLLTTS